MGKNQPRLIVLTGATRGLGRSLVNLFQELGHTVVGCERNKAIISELRTSFSGPHRSDLFNVTDDSQVATWVKSWVGELGSPDLLINNAAQQVVTSKASSCRTRLLSYPRAQGR